MIARVIRNVGGIHIEGEPGTYPGDTDTTQAVPKVSQADGVAVFLGTDSKPQTAVMIEIQRGENPLKAAVWPIYAWTTAVELNCKVYVLVIATSRKLGRWSRKLGGGKYADFQGAPLIVVDADSVPISDQTGDVDDSIRRSCVGKPIYLGLYETHRYHSPDFRKTSRK